MNPIRLDLLEKAIRQLAHRPKLTHRLIAEELRKLFAQYPEKAEAAIGHMYGVAFRKAEIAYEARGCRGRQDWTLE